MLSFTLTWYYWERRFWLFDYFKNIVSLYETHFVSAAFGAIRIGGPLMSLKVTFIYTFENEADILT